MYTVGELINNHISDSSVTKNNIIRLLNIDRSTFYQMLKGKRLPSAAQLGTILNAISIPSYEKKHISEVYMSEKLSVSEYSNRKAIINLIDTLREGIISDALKYDDITSEKALSDNGAVDKAPEQSSAANNNSSYSVVLNNRSDIMNFIRNRFLSKAVDGNDASISIHVPIFYLNHIGFFDTIKMISSNPNSSFISYDHIICYPAQITTFTDDLIQDFTSYISFLMSVNARFNSYYYYDSTDTMDLKATLFPYYIIFQDGLLLMNNTCEKAVFTMDKDIVLLYKNEFDIFKSQLSSIFTNTKDVETVIPYLLSLPDKTKTYYITYKPGISYLATDELIDEFIPEELREMCRIHYRAFQHTDYKEFIAAEGLIDFMRGGGLKELGFNIEANNKEHYAYVAEKMMSRFGKTLFLLNSDILKISDNWCIYCIEHEQVVLVPVLKGKRFITITERNIVEAFTDFFENITEDVILMNEGNVFELLSKLKDNIK